MAGFWYLLFRGTTFIFWGGEYFDAIRGFCRDARPLSYRCMFCNGVHHVGGLAQGLACLCGQLDAHVWFERTGRARGGGGGLASGDGGQTVSSKLISCFFIATVHVIDKRSKLIMQSTIILQHSCGSNETENYV